MTTLSMRAYLEWPALLLAATVLLLLTYAWSSLRRECIYAVLLGALALYGATTLAQLPDLAADFSASAVQAAALVFAIGSVCLVVAIVLGEALLGTRRSSPMWSRRLAEGARVHASWSVAFGVASLALFLIGNRTFEMTWSEARDGDGLVAAAATFLLLLSFPGIVAAWRARRPTAASVLVIINGVGFLLSGSRAAVLGALAYLAWGYVLAHESAVRRLLRIAGLAMIAVGFHVLLRFARGMTVVDLWAAVHSGGLLEMLATSPATSDLSGGEIAIAKYFVFAVQTASAEVYGFMTSAVRLLLILVPSSVVTSVNKPIDVTYLLWAEAYSQNLFAEAEGQALLREFFESGVYGSVHPTLFGELFAAGLWPSLIASSGVIGLFCVFINRCLSWIDPKAAVLVLGPVLVGMWMVARGNSVIGFGYFVYLTIFAVVLIRLQTLASASVRQCAAPQGQDQQ